MQNLKICQCQYAYKTNPQRLRSTSSITYRALQCIKHFLEYFCPMNHVKMSKLQLTIFLLALVIGISHQSTVNVATAKSKVGIFYAKGCSGLTAELLGKPWKKASSYTQRAYIGANGRYTGVTAGEVVGFPGHVAVYIGDKACMFVDVQGPNKKARCINSYGSQRVYKYDY